MTQPNIEKLLMTSQAISPDHLEDLSGSLITPEAAREARIRTTPPDAVPKILGACNYGWASPQVESMLAFPYRSLNGDAPNDYFRFKVFPPISTRDGKSAKYLQPAGTQNHLYCPPGVDPGGKETIYITEGEKKSLCLTLQGFQCLGLGGVCGWRTRDKDGNSKVIPDFEAVNWKKRDVVIVFDADIEINEHVQRAEAELAQELIRRKARVFIMRLPYGPGCAKGVDDYLVKHGKAAFEKLKRKPVKPRQQIKQSITKTEIETDNPLSATPYLIDQGRICFLKQVGSGRNVAQVVSPLCNFVAQCKEEIIRDDGRDTIREFIIDGTLDTGQPLPAAAVRATEFRGMGWIGKHWGMAANLTAGQSAQDRVREAIQHLSRNTRQRVVYTHSGWRKLDGIWVFLHGGGAINGPDGVEVDLGPELSRYSLPPPGGKEAAMASFQLLDIGPWKITAPFISSTFLAPLADQLKVDFSLGPFGPTGSLKSTLAALFLAHFGNFDRLTLPGQWSSTANALERRAFILKDLPFVIDDFAPQHDARKTSELEAKAHRIIRAAGNRVGRQRLFGDMTERQTYDPRCLIISTGEMTPTGESLAARYFSFEIDRQMIDMARLTVAQNNKHLLAQAMSAYLAWLAQDLDKILSEARDIWKAYRTTAQSEAHPRVPEMVAWLMLGFELFLRFMAHMEILSDTYELEKGAWETFTGLAQIHGKLIEGERPTRKFLNILRELFIQKRVYVLGTDGTCPQDYEDLGWKTYDDPGDGEHIGWVDEGYLYLMPEATLKVVQEVLRRQGDHLGIGKNTLFKGLAKEKIIESGVEGENTRQKKIKGRNKRVLYMVRSAIGGGSGNGSAE